MPLMGNIEKMLWFIMNRAIRTTKTKFWWKKKIFFFEQSQSRIMLCNVALCIANAHPQIVFFVITHYDYKIPK